MQRAFQFGQQLAETWISRGYLHELGELFINEFKKEQELGLLKGKYADENRIKSKIIKSFKRTLFKNLHPSVAEELAKDACEEITKCLKK